MSTQNKVCTLVVCILLLPGMFSCDNSKEASDSQTKDDTSTAKNPGKSGSKEAVTFSYGDFSILKLSKDDLVKLFEKPNTQKVLLQFVDDNTAGNDIPNGLMGTGATKANVTTSDSVKLIEVTGTTAANFPGIKYMGNLELSQKDINKILGRPGNSPIRDSTAKDLYFEPVLSPTYPNYVVYYVGLTYPIASNLKLEAPPTNPSPPAAPCNPCQ